MGKIDVYIDALPLAEPKMSGIGHLTLEMVRGLSINPSLNIKLVLPLGKRKHIVRHRLSNVSVQVLPLPARILSTMLKLRIVPPVDLILGAGIYVFPNYRNWPLTRSKSLTYFHDAAFLLHPQTVAPKNLRYLQAYTPVWLHRTDRILTLSESSKADLVTALAIEPKAISVISCGVDHNVFYEREISEVKAAKMHYEIMCDKYLLYIGNFEPRKNLERLLLAYELLPTNLSNDYALVLIGGGGWLNEGIFALIDELQVAGLRIICPKKYVEDADLPALLSGATALVHPALYEGFGLSPLQAMACGTPTIVSNSSSLPEVVGGAGILVDPSDERDISAKIEELLISPKLRQTMKIRGLARAKKYSWVKSTEQLYNCIQQVNKKPKGNHHV